MRFLLALLSLLILTSCSGPGSAHVTATSAMTAEETRILEIARTSARERARDLSQLEFNVPQRAPEGGWSVLVWRVPKVPGGFSVIQIDEHDKVIWDSGY
jgi:hypothetical protein